MKSCPYCGKNIKRSAVKCQYCQTDLTTIGLLGRFSNATLVISTIAVVLSALVSIYSAITTTNEGEEISSIRDHIDKVNSEVSYQYVFIQYNKMEDNAANWRRCKFLNQPDCELLSLFFITSATNTIHAFTENNKKMKEDNLKSIQELICVGLHITISDGENRGLFASIQDHIEANMKDEIINFMDNCPIYNLKYTPAMKIEK